MAVIFMGRFALVRVLEMAGMRQVSHGELDARNGLPRYRLMRETPACPALGVEPQIGPTARIAGAWSAAAASYQFV
jgi:hypothetical protein